MTELIEAHPAPYRHITKEQLDHLIDSTAQLLTEPMDNIDFFKLTSPIYHEIRDGHTALYMPSKWLKNYRTQYGIFPYKVHVTAENKLYLIKNHGQDETISLGAEVLKLNNVPVATFIESISPYITYEQENFRNSKIQTNFDFYLLLYFGKINSIDIDYLGDKERSHTVNYISYKDWKADREDEEMIKQKKIMISKPYDYKKIAEGIGLLKIYSFSFSSDNKYRDYLRTIFKEKITSLIIDVRGNTGGFPKTVSDLIHYISEKYFKTMAQSEMKVSKPYQQYFQERTRGNIHQYSFRNLRHHIDLDALYDEKLGTLVKEEAFYNETPKEIPNEFTGDVFLLIDKRTYSASSSFAATARCYQLGILIGEETGGTKVFHANSMYKKLPHSANVCAMATARKYTACFHEEDEGIQPDIKVTPSILQLVAGRDAVLDYTLRIIAKANDNLLGRSSEI